MPEALEVNPAMHDTPYPPVEAIRTIAVVGTGSVGAGWAALFLAHGWRVVAHDPAVDAEAAARTFIRQAWPSLKQLGITTQAVAPLHALRFVDSATKAAQAADVVQENVPEKPALKAQVLAELGAAAGPQTLILSSTGGMPPTQLQQYCQHPERLVVLHPFNPPHLIPLVEVAGGRHTAAEAINWTLAFARYLGKKPIHLRTEAHGHMTNRLQFALVREAVRCCLEGMASAADIDAGMTLGCNQPIGPLALADMIGLDVCLAIMEVYLAELGDGKYRPCPLLKEMVAAGRLGRKTGQGVYTY